MMANLNNTLEETGEEDREKNLWGDCHGGIADFLLDNAVQRCSSVIFRIPNQCKAIDKLTYSRGDYRLCKTYQSIYKFEKSTNKRL